MWRTTGGARGRASAQRRGAAWRRVRCTLASASACALLAPTAAGAATPGEPLAPDVQRQLDVLDRFVGRWRVTLHTRVPAVPVITYTETYRWTLGRRFIHATVDDRSDGVTSVSYGTFDPARGGYLFWIFMSTGAYFYLDAGRWDERARTMTWTSPAGSQIDYESRCSFPGPDLRQCRTRVQDWKGSVISDFEFRAERIVR